MNIIVSIWIILGALECIYFAKIGYIDITYKRGSCEQIKKYNFPIRWEQAKVTLTIYHSIKVLLFSPYYLVVVIYVIFRRIKYKKIIKSRKNF